MGIEFDTQMLDTPHGKVKAQIWDTAGQERFKSMTPLCFKDADGVIMVCDLTDKSSLMGLRDWLKIIQDHAPEDVGTFFIL